MPQPITPKTPPLLQEPDRANNLLKAELMIAETWEIFPGPTLTSGALKILGKCLLNIAETWTAAEALMELIRQSCQRRPVPFEMRRIYSDQIGMPADGIRDYEADLSQFMGGGGSTFRQGGGDAA